MARIFKNTHVFSAPKLFFPCNEYFGSDFKQSSTFQRQNDLVRIIRLISIQGTGYTGPSYDGKSYPLVSIIL